MACVVAEPLKQLLFHKGYIRGIRPQRHILQPHFHLWPQKKLQGGKGGTAEATRLKSNVQNPCKQWANRGTYTAWSLQNSQEQDLRTCFSFFLLVHLRFCCSYIVPTVSLYSECVCGELVSYSL